MAYKVELSLNCNDMTWVDYSDFSDVTKMRRFKELDSENNPSRRSASNVTFYGSAYVFIKTNLIDSTSRAFNHICVRITDNNFSTPATYLFKMDNKSLRWCEGEECEFEADLVEVNEALSCANKTLIADNTSGDYQQYTTSTTYPHPRFRYCDVIKPTFLFGVIVTFLNSISLLLASFNIIAVVVNAIVTAINSALGTNINTVPLPSSLISGALGCDRAWPSPFVRTYIDNACSVCGLTVDATKSPILHDVASDYYNSALITAYTTKGVKVVGSMGYIPSNQPSWTLTMFLSRLNKIFNGRWYITDAGELYFDRKDRLGQLVWGAGNQWDLSGVDAPYMLTSVCYSWNGKGKPYRIYLKWGTDATDAIGNELLKRFNGEHIDSSSPQYTETIEDTMSDFGAAAFVLDGKDAPWDINLVKSVDNQLLLWGGSGNDYNTCLKSQTDTLQLAKIVTWDGTSPMEDARVTRQPYVDYLTIPALEDDEPSDLSGTIINPADCRYYNPLFSFDPDADGIHPNLWSYFHSIDAPIPGKKDLIGFEVTMDYCKEEYNDMDIFQSVLMPDGVTEGEINSVEFDHENRQIIVKGFLKN